MKLMIDNWRWSGRRFIWRTGKFLPEKIYPRSRCDSARRRLTLFQKQCNAPVFANDLVIRVQPEEGISWRLNGKVPRRHAANQTRRARDFPLQDNLQRPSRPRP